MAGREPAGLRVLQVASSLYAWGGVERYVAYLTQGLADRGHRVEVACPAETPLARRLPGRTASIQMRRKLDFAGFAAYLRLFRANRYDVVHGHFSPDFTLPAMAARMTRQPLLVMTRHVSLRWNRRKAQSYAKLWDHIIPVSDSVKRRLEESGIPASRMTVAKAGSPPLARTRPREATRAELGFAPDEFVVGSFSRLTPEKGIEVLIDAAAMVPDLKVSVFGDGPSVGELRLRAEKLAGRVRFHGLIQDVADAMGAVDVVAIPSVWEEAFPYAALEALALAQPIAASRIGGLPEIVEDGTNGRLFETAQPVDLARVLVSLRDDPAGRQALGLAGQDLYRREYTVERMAERIEAVYLAQSGVNRR